MKLNAINQLTSSFKNTELMPALFLGHGCWSVVKHLYPEADLPVIQLSLDRMKDPQYHYDLARELSCSMTKQSGDP